MKRKAAKINKGKGNARTSSKSKRDKSYAGKSNSTKRKKNPAREAAKRSGRIKPSRIFVYTLALAALGGGGYLVYDKVKGRKLSESATDTSSDPEAVNVTASSTTPSASIAKSSSTSAKPVRYRKVARTAALPITKDNTAQVVFNPSSLAAGLYRAAQNKNAAQVLDLLRQMNSVADYSSVNEQYKKQSFIAKTIVTDLLHYAFSGNEQTKGQIKNEFTRMGLKVNSSGTWSLQGIRLFKDLITIRETVVVDARSNRIPVKRNTILGDEVQVANGMTWFRSIDHTLLQVPTQDVRFT